MRKTIEVLVIFVLMLTISGCATSMMLSLKKEPQHFIPSGDPNKGYIYVYRESNLLGCVRGIYVTANGKRIGGLNNGTYFVYEADPGDVFISVENWLGDNPSRKILVEAGKKYYLKGSLTFGSMDATPYIERVNNEDGEKAIELLTYATLKE